MAEKNKSAKKDRNRSSGQNAAYKAEHRHEKSHVKRIMAHMSRYGLTKDAEEALIKYSYAIGATATSKAQAFIKQLKAA